MTNTPPEVPATLSDYLIETDFVSHGTPSLDPPSLDDSKAAALLYRLGLTEERIRKNSEQAQALRMKADQWEATVNEPLANYAVRLRETLEAYAIYQRETAERKTINLPFGTLKTTPARPKWVITDQPAFEHWAFESGNDVLLRRKYEVEIAKLKTLPVVANNVVDEQTGEAIPGVEVISPERDYNPTVKPNI